MRALVIGSGAREHTIAWALSRSRRVSALFIAPGNAGTHAIGSNFPDVGAMDFDAIVDLCVSQKVDLVFVGPEAPLAAGLADRLAREKIPAVGPTARAAQLEASKVFSKRFMRTHGVPTAAATEYSEWERFRKDMAGITAKVVVKKSGLAAGKGVLESDDAGAVLSFGRGILRDDTLLVEEFLQGYEVSVFAFTDGEDYLLLPVCADYKKAGEGDTGLNTGGMGAVCPVPGVDGPLLKSIEDGIVKPTLAGMSREGLGYSGVLYFGLMITEKGPHVLEYNVRLGDPECQVLLPLLASDFGDIVEGLVNRSIGGFPLDLRSESAVGVVVASPGYPGSYPKGVPVESLPSAGEEGILVFHASTERDAAGRTLTGGGRCFTVVGLERDVASASRKARAAAEKVRFDGAWFRRDIGEKFSPAGKT